MSSLRAANQRGGDAGDLHVALRWGSWLLGLCGGRGAVSMRSETTLLPYLDVIQLLQQTHTVTNF